MTLASGSAVADEATVIGQAVDVARRLLLPALDQLGIEYELAHVEVLEDGRIDVRWDLAHEVNTGHAEVRVYTKDGWDTGLLRLTLDPESVHLADGEESA